jgi:hypothetical protein
MDIINMGKKSKKKQGLKFYFTLNGCLTIQSVYAETIEEAAKLLDEKYGEGNYTLGSLNKAFSKQEKKRINEISEKVTRDLLGETAGRIMHDINSF